LEPVILGEDSKIEDILSYYMGKNTPDRQDFIIGNLRIEKDEIESDELPEEALLAAEVEA